MNKALQYRLKIVAICLGVAFSAGLGVYIWCYMLGNCSGECIVIGQDVDSVCLHTAIRFGLAVLAACTVGYRVWVFFRYK